MYTKYPQSDPQVPPKGAKWHQSDRKTAPARLLGGPAGILRPVLNLVLAQMACTFSLSAPASPHLYASHLPVDIFMAQNWPKRDPKSPAYTPSNPKVAPKCKQSGYKFTPQLHKTVKVYWEHVYFSKTHQNFSKEPLMYTK